VCAMTTDCRPFSSVQFSCVLRSEVGFETRARDRSYTNVVASADHVSRTHRHETIYSAGAHAAPEPSQVRSGVEMLFNEESPAGALSSFCVGTRGLPTGLGRRYVWWTCHAGGAGGSGRGIGRQGLESSSSWATMTFRPPSSSRSHSRSLTRALTTRTRQLHTRGRLCHHMRKGLERQPVVER